MKAIESLYQELLLCSDPECVLSHVATPLRPEVLLFPLDLTDVTILRLHQTLIIESSIITACIFLACVCISNNCVNAFM